MPIDSIAPEGLRQLEWLSAAICEELECRGAEPCRVDIIVSDAATQRGADLQGDDSQGRVWIREITDTADPQNGPCAVWTRTIEVGILRCHQTVDADGRNLPDASRYEYESRRAYIDKDSVYFAALRAKPRMFPASWRPYGPQSYAIGGIWTITSQYWTL